MADVKASGDLEQMRAAIDELLNLWALADAEENYLRCVVNGEWPEARQRLVDAIAKIDTGAADAPVRLAQGGLGAGEGE